MFTHPMTQWLARLTSNHRLSLLCGFDSPQVVMLRTCPNMTLAVEWDKTKTNFDLTLNTLHFLKCNIF